MINLEEKASSNFTLIDTINEKLLLIDSIILYQEEEILKCESSILQFEHCLKKQNEALHTFIMEKHKLETAKYIPNNQRMGYNKNLYSTDSLVAVARSSNKLNNVVNYFKFNEAEETNQENPNSQCNVLWPRDTLEIEFTTPIAPNSFYKAISDFAVIVQKTPFKTYTLTQIPNFLKVLEDDRCMTVIRLDSTNQTSFEVILGHNVKSTFYFHVCRGNGFITALKGNERCRILFHPKMTIKVPQFCCEGIEYVLENDGLLSAAIEELTPFSDEKVSKLTEESECFTFVPPPSFNKCKVSFLCKLMTTKELRDRIVFLDVKSALDSEHFLIPLSIAILDYNGNIVLSSAVCPRAFIRQYCTVTHGLTEKDCVEQRDDFVVLKEVEQILQGRVIIGHDLRFERTILPIPWDRIAGVRDLQGNLAIGNIMKSGVPDNTKTWTLDSIALKMGIRGEGRVHNALEDARVIREIYLAVEHNWMNTPRTELEMIRMRTVVPIVRSINRLELANQRREKMNQEYELKEAAEKAEAERKEDDDIAQGQSLQKVFVLPIIPIQDPECYIYDETGVQLKPGSSKETR